MQQIFDLGPGFGATTRNMPQMAQNLKIELFPRFYSQDSPLLDCNHLTMPKNLLDQNFEFFPRFPAIAQKAQNSPKFEN